MKRKWQICSTEELLTILSITNEQLKLAISESNINNYYANTYEVKKKNGIREICNVDKSNPLYAIQKKIYKYFLSNIMVSDNAYGFRKGSNYYDFLSCHLNFYKNSFFLRLDISSFFDSISEDLVRETFSYYVSKEKNAIDNTENISEVITDTNVLDIICKILTYNGKIVQGAPSSPAVSNIIFRQLDIRIEKYCDAYGVQYSRYADDMLFSANNDTIHGKRFITGINSIIGSKGFKLNNNKIIRAKDEISLNGFVVGENLRLSRKKMSRLLSALYYLEKDKRSVIDTSFWEDFNSNLSRCPATKTLHFKNDYELINYLAGNRSFLLASITNSNSEQYLNRCKRIIKRLEIQIKKYTAPKLKESKKRITA
ncbi:MAG: reverse transcriptase family protein [Butyrivibrio sp.]|jgi:hypothetical protein|nr:reverse transcriptase family protein [Butyrivibrio sp.]